MFIYKVVCLTYMHRQALRLFVCSDAIFVCLLVLDNFLYFRMLGCEFIFSLVCLLTKEQRHIFGASNR